MHWHCCLHMGTRVEVVSEDLSDRPVFPESEVLENFLSRSGSPLDESMLGAHLEMALNSR